MNPTDSTYKSINLAYDFFNKNLFDSKLPACLITMQRRNKSLGYFVAERFESRGKEGILIHEIALNPGSFKDRTDAAILSILVHEMCHLWQQENGNPPRKNYHNREWATKMEGLGLIPSNTGEPEGKKTGQSMTHYIEEGGRFDNLVAEFLKTNESIIYQDRPEFSFKRKVKKSKLKYTCPTCGFNAWAKPNANLMCGEDKLKMDPEDLE